MAQTSLSTGSRSHLLHASRDDGQEVRVSRSTGMCESDPTYVPVGKKKPAFRRVENAFQRRRRLCALCNDKNLL